mmetsp:Transcript_10057/g.14929  ORF Transcript_10057/g.14929 Transcript_10057/m.14929 type:complete len:407 (+) Transcript_10057:117-1337(+)
MTMRYLTKRTHCILTNLLVVFLTYCTSFSTNQICLIPSSNHISSRPNNIRSVVTILAAGRERRISTTSNSNSAISEEERKMISAEEAARAKRLGQRKQRLQKEVSRENRISALEMKLKKAERMPNKSESEMYMTKAERSELQGLLKVRDNFEEQYGSMTFTKEHLEFKAMHNDAFIQLSKYCEEERDGKSEQPTNMFFLDGPDGGTASALIHKGGFDKNQCYVANRHESSCASLRISGGGLLPDENVVHATASEALTISEPITVDLGVDGSSAGKEDVDLVSLSGGKDGAFARIDFAAYYFDGCGGFVPHIIGMLSSALLRQLPSDDAASSGPIAVGYSLLGGNKDVVKKELTVSRALTIIARRRGMRMVHVLDDPLRYGISPDIQKIGGSNDGTFTTWLLLQAEN